MKNQVNWKNDTIQKKQSKKKKAMFPWNGPDKFFLRAAVFVIRLRGSLCGTID